MVGREPGCGLERQPQLCSAFFGAVVSGLSREGVGLFSFACDHCVEVKSWPCVATYLVIA